MNKEIVNLFRSILEAKMEQNWDKADKKMIRGLRKGGAGPNPSPTAQGTQGSIAALAAKKKAGGSDDRLSSFKAMQMRKQTTQTASHDPRSEFIDRIVDNISENRGERKDESEAYGPQKPIGKPIDGSGRPKNPLKTLKLNVDPTSGKTKPEPKKPATMTGSLKFKPENSSHDHKVNFINRTVDNLIERVMGKKKKKKGEFIGNQGELDVNGSGDLDAQDFEMLRKGKRKDETSDYASALDKKDARIKAKTPAKGGDSPGRAAHLSNAAGRLRRGEVSGGKPDSLDKDISRELTQKAAGMKKPKLP